jgi:glucose-6-phosphate 1-dehydrogenase
MAPTPPLPPHPASPASLDDGPGRPADPCTVVIFGATGDLAARKLVPALYNLRRDALLDDGFAVVGVARRSLDPSAYQRKIGSDLQEFAPPLDPDLTAWLLGRSSYLSGGFDDDSTGA